MIAAAEMPEYILWLVLKTCRRNRGLSQRAAADRIGVSQPVIAEWESGKSAIGEATLVKVARAYGLDVRGLLLEGLAGEAAPKRRAKAVRG